MRQNVIIDQNIKNRWLDALRSGNYQKCELTMRDQNDCFCALGVLADVVAPNDWVKNEYGWNNKGFDPYDGNNYRNKFNPWYVSDENDGTSNDIDPSTFDQVADWIEENLNVEG